MKHACIVAAVAALLTTAAVAAEVGGEPEAHAVEFHAVEAHQAAIADWRQRRHARLSSDEGWLTLVGLEWLRQGDNRLGSGPDADIRMPGGPRDWGTVTVDGELITYRPAGGAGITIDGEPADEARLVADAQGEPTVVRSGELSFYVIERGSYALRVKDRKAPTLMSFEGMENFPISWDWRFEARFEAAESGQTIEIADVLGRLEPTDVYGTAVFERDGVEYRLLGLREAGTEDMWFLFADRTNGRETYGAGRFLYSDGAPRDGVVVVDFNKAYNPPCAFTDYSTCPLPPQQNRLDLAVTAGEKDFPHH